MKPSITNLILSSFVLLLTPSVSAENYLAAKKSRKKQKKQASKIEHWTGTKWAIEEPESIAGYSLVFGKVPDCLLSDCEKKSSSFMLFSEDGVRILSAVKGKRKGSTYSASYSMQRSVGPAELTEEQLLVIDLFGENGGFSARQDESTFNILSGAFQGAEGQASQGFMASRVNLGEQIGKSTIVPQIKTKGSIKRKIDSEETVTIEATLINRGRAPNGKGGTQMTVLGALELENVAIVEEDNISSCSSTSGVFPVQCTNDGMGAETPRMSAAISFDVPRSLEGQSFVLTVKSARVGHESPSQDNTRERRITFKVKKPKAGKCGGDKSLPCIVPNHPREQCVIFEASPDSDQFTDTWVGLIYVGYQVLGRSGPVYVWAHSANRKGVLEDFASSSFAKAGEGFIAVAQKSAGKLCKHFRKNCTNFDGIGIDCGFDAE